METIVFYEEIEDFTYDSLFHTNSGIRYIVSFRLPIIVVFRDGDCSPANISVKNVRCLY